MREALVVENVYKKWNRPDPTRPGPAQPAISATRLPVLKMTDLGPFVFPESPPVLGRSDWILKDSEGF